MISDPGGCDGINWPIAGPGVAAEIDNIPRNQTKEIRRFFREYAVARDQGRVE